MFKLLQRPCHQAFSQLGALTPQRIQSSLHFLAASHHQRLKSRKDSLGVKCIDFKKSNRLLYTAKSLKQKQVDILSLVQDARLNMNSVQMKDMKNAPLPVFWCSVAGLIPYVAPVFVQVFTGYMPALGTAQLMYSGTILSFLGGLKFGSMLHCDKNDCSWNNIGLAVVPAIWAWSALLLPTGIAFLTVGTGLIASLIIDLATSKYPPWFVSLKVFLTLTAALFVLLCLKQYMFNNRHYYEAAVDVESSLKNPLSIK